MNFEPNPGIYIVGWRHILYKMPRKIDSIYFLRDMMPPSAKVMAMGACTEDGRFTDVW